MFHSVPGVPPGKMERSVGLEAVLAPANMLLTTGYKMQKEEKKGRRRDGLF